MPRKQHRVHLNCSVGGDARTWESTRGGEPDSQGSDTWEEPLRLPQAAVKWSEL